MTKPETVNLVINNAPQIVKTDSKALLEPPPLYTTLNNAEAQPNSKKERGKPFRQVLAALVANLGTMNTGLVFGFSAVVIPQLLKADSIIHIDESQSSWIAALSSASTPVGCILSGYLMDVIGRKLTLILTEIPLVLGWILTASASNVEMIYAGRLFVGLGSGMVGAPARVYTSEVTQPHLRGMLSALASVSISLGILFQYTIGTFLSWQYLCMISACIPILAFICMLFMPETPNYLVARSKDEDACKSLAKLRGSTYNLQKEVDQLRTFMEKTNSAKSSSARDTLRALLSPSALKPFCILVLYFMIYQFSGVNTITFYAVEIFEISGTNMNKFACTISLGVVRLIFTIIACILLRKCGRRPLTFISGIGCGISMLGLGTYMYYKYEWDHAIPKVEPVATWFPVMCIFLFTITCTLGFLVVPWVMIGELYPQKVRGIVGGMTTCCAHIFVFIVVKTYPILSYAIYTHGAFMTYGCISLVGTIFFYCCLPETKGKTLQEIEDYFSGRVKSLDKKKLTDKTTNSTAMPPVIVIEKDKLLSK